MLKLSQPKSFTYGSASHRDSIDFDVRACRYMIRYVPDSKECLTLHPSFSPIRGNEGRVDSTSLLEIGRLALVTMIRLDLLTPILYSKIVCLQYHQEVKYLYARKEASGKLWAISEQMRNSSLYFEK